MSLFLEQVNADDLKILIQSAIDEKLLPVTEILASTMSVVISRKSAAEILDVTPATINNYVGYGILKPVYKEGKSQMDYKLSEVLILKGQLKRIPHANK